MGSAWLGLITHFNGRATKYCPHPKRHCSPDLHMYNELDFGKLTGFNFDIEKLMGFHLVQPLKVSALVLNLVSGFG